MIVIYWLFVSLVIIYYDLRSRVIPSYLVFLMLFSILSSLYLNTHFTDPTFTVYMLFYLISLNFLFLGYGVGDILYLDFTVSLIPKAAYSVFLVLLFLTLFLNLILTLSGRRSHGIIEGLKYSIFPHHSMMNEYPGTILIFASTVYGLIRGLL